MEESDGENYDASAAEGVVAAEVLVIYFHGQEVIGG